MLTLLDTAEARSRSRSKNSIKKRNEKLKKMKNEMLKIESRMERMGSKNAFRNSKFVKAIVLMEEDEDYFDDAPIINIRFKRDTNIHSSLLLSKLAPQH